MQKYKVVMVGDLAVGKTAIAGRILGNDFDSSYRATVGATFLSIEKTIKDVPCIINLWDTAGQESFRSLLSMYARDTQGALVVCDISNEESFFHIQDWCNFVRDASPGAEVVILANKVDLSPSKRVVTAEKLQEYSNKHSIPYFETSALQGKGYEEAFDNLCERLYDKENSNAQDDLDLNKNKKSGC